MHHLLQATSSSALPYALWKSTSHTVICHHCSSFHCATLRSVWFYLFPNSLKVANHKLDPFLSSPSTRCTTLDLVDPPLSLCPPASQPSQPSYCEIQCSRCSPRSDSPKEEMVTSINIPVTQEHSLICG